MAEEIKRTLKYLSDDKFKVMNPLFGKKGGGRFDDRNLDKIDTIVFHWTGSNTLQDAFKTLKNDGHAYHFIIDNADGMVYQLVDIRRKCAHAGVSYGPNGPWVNGHSIGISFQIPANNDYNFAISEEAYQSSVKLISELIDILPLKHITGHQWVAPIRRVDPYTYPFTRLMGEQKIRDNKLKLWKTGYGPFPKGLEDCECVEKKDLNATGGKFCKVAKGDCYIKGKKFSKDGTLQTFNPSKIKYAVASEKYSDWAFIQDNGDETNDNV